MAPSMEGRSRSVCRVANPCWTSTRSCAPGGTASRPPTGRWSSTTRTPTSARTILTASSRRRRSSSACWSAPTRAPSCSRCTSPAATRCRTTSRMAAAAASDRLVAFCRLDPRVNPAAEARRCLDAGAVGIKLHPRAEQFGMDEPGVREIIAVAHERKVPVLIHAGRGIPALGENTVRLSAEFPDARFILAHAAISDLAWLWHVLRRSPERLHRHGLVEPGRPDRAVLAGGAVADRVGERLAVRRADHRRVHARALRAAGGRLATRRCARSWAGRSRGSSPARTRSGWARRRARWSRRCIRCWTASSRT